MDNLQNIETTDSSGFYKLDGDLLYAPNFVLNSNYEIRRENQTENIYPIDGWYWFNSEGVARAFFGTEATA